MGIRESLRRVRLIALTEGRRTGGSFNRRTVALLAVMAVAMGTLTPYLTQDGLDFDRGLYRVAATDGSPLILAIDGASVFRRVAVDDARAAVNAGDADIAVVGDLLYYLDTEKGKAAAAALRQAAKDFTFAALLHEPDQVAAFPVRVELVYVEQERVAAGGSGAPQLPGGSPFPPTEGTSEREREGTATGSGKQGGSTSGPTSEASAPRTGFSLLPPERSLNTPETLAPPFPFRSLILAYLFLIPMNFVVQVYAGSAISERLGRKGEALLASPARPWEIIVGKAFPYFLLMMLVSAAIAVWIGAGWLSILALVPLVLIFLALEFVAAMFARSFRELTFVTVFTSVLVTIYAFLPAVFSEVHPVALVSPITLIVMDLRGVTPTLGQFLYSTLPLTFVSAMLYVLGAALYREEDLFHQKPLLAKAVDSLARQVKGVGSGFKLTFLLIPFVFVAELLLVTFLTALPIPDAVGGGVGGAALVMYLPILLAVALVEELFKGLPSYAAAARGIVHPKRIVLFGALAGLGFFVAEKGFLLASLAGLFDVSAGATVFGTTGDLAPGVDVAWSRLALLLLAPLTLHVTTASISAWGAGRGKDTFAAAFLLAVVVHTAYNLIVVMRGGI